MSPLHFLLSDTHSETIANQICIPEHQSIPRCTERQTGNRIANGGPSWLDSYRKHGENLKTYTTEIVPYSMKAKSFL